MARVKTLPDRTTVSVPSVTLLILMRIIVLVRFDIMDYNL